MVDTITKRGMSIVSSYSILLIQGGGHSHRRRVYSCDRGQDVVKWSRHFFGGGQTVKQYSRAYIK